MLQETLVTFPVLTLDTTSSETLTFLLESLNGAIQILPFRTQTVLLFSKILFYQTYHKTVRRLSHLCEHKFKHNFQDCLNPVCSCDLDIESTPHFLLHCIIANDERYPLQSPLNKVDSKLPRINELFVIKNSVIWQHII